MPNEIFSESGVSGLKTSFGRVDEEYQKELKGDKAVKVYKEMSSNDSTVGAILLAIELLIKAVDWRIEAGGKETDYQSDADFVTECWNDLNQPPSNVLAEILSMNPYGWSYFETVYKLRQGVDSGSKYSDGKIGWRKFALRSQDTLYQWQMDKQGGIQGMIQMDPTTFNKYTIPIEKSLLFRTSTIKNNPEGKSLLRNAYRNWYFKKNLENIEGTGAERDLVGVPMARVPASIMSNDASSAEKLVYQQIKDMLAQLKNDECAYICLPSDTDEKGNHLYDFELVSSSGTKAIDTDKIIRRHDRGIAISVLADFLFLGHEKVGSYALSADKTDLFAQAISAIANQICGVMNQYAIPRLMQLNAIKRDRYPKFSYGEIKSVDLDVLGRFITTLTSAGMPLFPDPEIENYFKKLAKIPLTENK